MVVPVYKYFHTRTTVRYTTDSTIVLAYSDINGSAFRFHGVLCEGSGYVWRHMAETVRGFSVFCRNFAEKSITHTKTPTRERTTGFNCETVALSFVGKKAWPPAILKHATFVCYLLARELVTMLRFIHQN